MKHQYSLKDRVVSLVLSVIMVLGMVPVGTAAAVDSSSFGTVSAITSGAEITGNQTAEISVVFSGGSTIEWSAADTSVGRYQDGWWAGIKIIAPASLVMDDAKYYYNADSNQPRNFSTYKDSADGASEQYINMWIPLNDIIDGSYAARTIHFDWDGDGTYEQTITVDADSSSIVLTKDSVQVHPALASVSGYTGGTVSGDTTGSVTVHVDSVELSWDPADESIGRNIDAWWVGIKVTAPSGMTEDQLKNAVYQSKGSATGAWSTEKSFWSNKDSAEGASEHYIGMWFPITEDSLKSFIQNSENITMWYQFDWNGDGVFEQSITFSVDPNGVTLNGKDQTGFAFADSNPADISVVEGSYQNVASGGQGDGEITYEIVEGGKYASVANDGTLTFGDLDTDSVSITVQATKAADSGGFYNEATARYTITVGKEVQSLQFTKPNPEEITYEPGATLNNPLAGTIYGEVTYEITEGADVATVDNDGLLTILKAGEVTVEATVTGNGEYTSAQVSYTVTIVKASQTEFAFATPNPDDISYNDNGNRYTNAVENALGDGKLVYSIVSGNDVASIDEETGELTILKPGTVKVQAKKGGDACYEDSEVITYTLKINKADQELSFNEGEVNRPYGILEYTNETLASSTLHGEGALTYEIVGENKIGASIDSETGKLTFTDSEDKIGSITVKVTRAADDYYDECSAQYTFTLEYQATPETPYTLSGNTMNNSGWYTGEVTITAPAGYQISYTNALSTSDWASSVVFGTEGANNATTVYLKDSNGFITDAIAVTGISIDATAPESLQITYTKPAWEVVLEKITFGLYQSNKLEVEISATDSISGIASLTYNIGDEEKSIDFAGTASASHSFTIDAQYRNRITLTATDVSGWQTKRQDGIVVVLDTENPDITAEYQYTSGSHREDGGIFFTQEDTTITFILNEANFDLSGLDIENDPEGGKTDVPVVKVNSVEKAVSWIKNAETGNWEGGLTLSGNGDYVITVTYTDPAGNAMEPYEQEVHIDNTRPIISVGYDNIEAINEKYYNADRTAEVTITAHNFKAEDVNLTVETKDITGAVVAADDYAAYAKNPDNWSQDGDVWTLNTAGMRFDTDAIYTVELKYTDLAGNTADTYLADFVIDKTGAANIEIEYSTSVPERVLEELTFGFYQAEVVVTVTAEDMTAGVEYFELTYTRQDGVSVTNTETFTTDPLNATPDADNRSVFTVTYKIPAQARGTVSAAVMDRAGNNSSSENAAVIVVDDVAPTREVIYTPYKILDAETMLEVETYQEGDNAILYYKDEAVVTFQITEANFDLSLLDEDTRPVIQVNGAPVEVVWTQDGDVWTAVYTITGDGDYVVTMTYMDLSSNEMVDYESCKIAIDGTAPVIDVKHEDGTPTQTQEGIQYYKNTQTVVVQITDHNFRADDVVLTVTAKDVTRADVDIAAEAYADYARDRANWTSNGDVHTLKLDGMVFDIDAIYTIEIVYDDICDNFATDYAADNFVVDHNAPENLTITYSTPVIEKVIEKLTFGFYKAEVAVTITCDDITAGVDFFEWSYTKQADTSDVNAESYGGKIESGDITYSEKDKVATITIKIPADARGHVTAAVTDRAGNSSNRDDNTIINVVDKIAPEISVEYTADSTYTKVQFVDGNKLTVESFDKAANAIYNGNVTATIVINEANFFEGVETENGVIHQVGIKLTKTDDNGNVTVIEYLPAGAAQEYTDAKAEYITWADDGDSHTFSISYADNADYILEIEYTDLSTNEAGITASDGQTTTKAYTSKTVTVDKIAPAVQVEYSNTDVINTIGNCAYFDKTQSATITVTEHNFRASDIQAVVTAVDFLGENVSVADFAAQLTDEKNWTHNGNVHTAVIAFTADANYTFDIGCLDLAQNASADYTTDMFTVDTTAPTNLTVSYSTNVFQEILESITFGYYNATMTVTISADDPTTGIRHFDYSYLKNQDVSAVNAELLDQAIAAAEIKHDGITGTATFQIPKMVLANDNQFNGTVQFTAYDCSENSTELKDTTRIIVDNISPTATITYNEPVQAIGNSSYYSGNIEVTIAITEANFDAGDVIVTVTKDGEHYPVYATWRDNSLDSHTGSFVLTEDGDYTVSVQYRDKSGNQMADYMSNELTLDTTAPVIRVSDIMANSANKDAEYGFVIEFSDTNLDVGTIKSTLRAVVEKADGTYEVTEIHLGEVATIIDGQTYAYTVENLPDDGLYTLVCEVQDIAGNATTQVVLDDGQSYEQVQFSINRNGSVFGYGSEFTEKLVGQYYVYSVDSDIVIIEVNVDPIENYTVTLNGRELVEGTDYTTVQTSNDGEWSKKTYTIKKELFTAEGEYSIIVTSTDKANTTAFSDVKNLSLSFVVDQTKPVLTITGLEAGGRYQTDAQTVTLIPTDEGGRLNSLSVIVLDANGNPIKDAVTGEDISVRFEMSGEDLLKYLEENNGKVIFTIPDGYNNKVLIVCNDCAVNAENLTNEYSELFENVTVSQNWFIIFYANKPAFFGTIAGILALATIIFILIKRRKNKKTTAKV